jgi:NTE family protein
MTKRPPRSREVGPFDDWPRPLAFVLSGGGAFGSVQVGMMRALLERGIRPDLVVGSSVGALNGAVLAVSPDDAVETLSGLWLHMSRRAVFGRGIVGPALNLWRSRSLFEFGALGALIDRHLGSVAFGDLSLRFGAVATDALTGEPEVLSQGPLKPALLASSAVPGLFPAVTIGGRDYVDGGVTANIPIRQAIGFGARSVISLDATPPHLATRVPRSPFGGLIHATSLMLRSQRAHAVDELVHRYPVAVIPSSVPPDFGCFNFAHNRELLESSYALASATLDAWHAGAPVVLAPDSERSTRK